MKKSFPRGDPGVRRGAGLSIWLLVLAVGLAAAGLSVGVIDLGAAPVGRLHAPWWVLAALFAVVEAFVVHVHLRREAHTISLNELPLVVGLFWVSPWALLVSQIAGAGAVLLLHRRQAPVKLLFNLAQFALSSTVAIVLFRWAIQSGDGLGPAGWLGAMAGVLAGGFVSVALIALAVFLATGTRPDRRMGVAACVSTVATLVATAVGLMTVMVAQADPRAVWLVVLPGITGMVAFRAYAGHRTRHEHLDLLYGSLHRMQSSPDLDAAVGELLTSSRRTFRAEVARVVLLPAVPGEPALEASVRDELATPLHAATIGETDRQAIEALSKSQEPLVFATGGPSGAIASLLGEHGVGDGMVAALRSDGTLFGMILIGGRTDVVTSFNSEDGRLLHTLVGHAGVLFEKDRLRRSMESLAKIEEQMRHQAFHDGLTGLPNRALLAERISNSLSRSVPGGHEVAVLFLDLDDFKTINDSLGHSVGDELLVAVADRVRACVRQGDTPARLGGDEFAVLVDGAAEGDGARLAGRLIDAMNEPFHLPGGNVSVHSSVGIAHAQPGDSADEVLRKADLAMYDAKFSGKGGMANYDERMDERVRRRHTLAGALERAVADRAITVAFQPIVALEGGQVFGVEVLARWTEAELGPVPPAEFIPLAEEAGLILRIGNQVLTEACRQVREWQQRFPRHRELAACVNLSPYQLRPELVGEVSRALAATGLRPEHLVLEITESAAMRDSAAAIETMCALRDRGVRLALDDFGEGYSSLGHLRQFPIDFLKIARQLVAPGTRTPMDRTFLKAIIGLASAMRIRVVAEGIETLDQDRALTDLHCDFGQGFLYARPGPAAVVEEMLAGPLRVEARVPNPVGA